MARSHAIAALLGIGALALIGAAPPDHLPQCVHQTFAGITQTLADGTIVGDPDRGDWGCAGFGGEAGALPALPGGRAGAVDGLLPPPTALCMYPAAPNPAVPATRLQFALPTAGHVSLVVYGRHQGHGPRETFVARTLMDANLIPVGSFAVTWDLKDDHGVRVDPGIYRAILVVGNEALCGDIEVQ